MSAARDMPPVRHFVLVEPFKPADFSIHSDEQYAAAVLQLKGYLSDRRRAVLVSTTGTVRDVRLILARRRADLLAASVAS